MNKQRCFKVIVYTKDPQALWQKILKAIHKGVDSSVKSTEVIDTWRFKEDGSLFWIPGNNGNWILNAYFLPRFGKSKEQNAYIELLLKTEPHFSIRTTDASSYASHLMYELIAHFGEDIILMTLTHMDAVELMELSIDDKLDLQTAHRSNQERQTADILKKKKN